MKTSPTGFLTRRGAMSMIGGTAAAFGLGGLPRPGWAASHDGGGGMIRSHGYDYYGELKYPTDYSHFDYVNPDAPKGGEINLSALGTFDGFNRWASLGRPERNSGVVAEAMFADSPFGGGIPADSLTNSYCLLAESVEYPESQEYCIFHIRPEARFRNGDPLTAHDAAFTHNLFLEQGIPDYARAVKQRIKSVEVIDDHTLRYDFVDGISRRSLISQVGGNAVFSKKWYEETGERLDKPSLLSPMASGPYMLDDYEINRYVIYRRNPDYWGWHLPINKGRHNFDVVRFDYYTDANTEFQGFTSGEYTFRAEGNSKRWVNGYDFPNVENGSVVLEELPDQTPPTPRGFVFNTLRPIFEDRTVREALSLAFNFEWTQESLQNGVTSQFSSFTEGSPLEAKGLPEGAEKAFLESLGDVVPPEVFTEEAVVSHTSNPRQGDRLEPVDRRNKRRALGLLETAGWVAGSDGKLRNEAGDLLAFEIMISSSTDDEDEAIITNYVSNLNEFGASVTVEKIDTNQWSQRYYDKDFDMVLFRYGTLLTVGTGLNQMFGSEVAVDSSYNPASLRSPLVDAIIEKALDTTSSAEADVALMALDRALRWHRILIPIGYIPDTWLAYYDIYERPEVLPPYAIGYLDFWWFNQEKYEALKAKGILG